MSAHCDCGHLCRTPESSYSTSTSTTPTSSTTDTPPTPEQRIITCVYYLTNHDWNENTDGGALRVFHHNNEYDHHPKNNTTSATSSYNDDYTDIIPYRNRMVIFRSDKVEHQVLPSKQRSRPAITIWFYGTVMVGDEVAESAPNRSLDSFC